MSEWKEYDLSCLPDLTEIYEFRKLQGDGVEADWFLWELENVEAVCELEQGERIQYRKPDPLPPTHTEIMTKWFNIGECIWIRVLQYDSEYRKYLRNYDPCIWENSTWFAGRESADIPPETV